MPRLNILTVKTNFRLLHLREGANLTRVGLANKVAISRELYGQIEDGTANPKLSHIWKLAAFFKVSIDWLFCEKCMKPTIYQIDHKKYEYDSKGKIRNVIENKK